MSTWIDSALDCLRRGEVCVAVTVSGARGSTPREVGARMLVFADTTLGTIGGGQLEYQCIDQALALLHEHEAAASRRLSRSFPLGPSCGQCCGGVADILFERLGAADTAWLERLAAARNAGTDAVLVTPCDASAPLARLVLTRDAGDEQARVPSRILRGARRLLDNRAGALREVIAFGDGTKSALLFEPVRAPDFDLFLFGAGHVGTALAHVLGGLHCRVRWIDSRAALLDGAGEAHLEARVREHPYLEVDGAPPGSYFVVVTHSHALDQEICNRILLRGDFAYCGLIGSRSKRRRFEKRFRALGIAEAAIDRLVCPIGIEGISSKSPAAIAVAVAAQLLQVREARAGCGAVARVATVPPGASRRAGSGAD